MPSIFDVAKYILSTIGDVSTMKLQKLCFYSQAISLADFNHHIFDEDFEAWANGPVCRELFKYHRGKFIINSAYIENDKLTGELTRDHVRAIDRCLAEYGDKDPDDLSELSHSEDPWLHARGNTPEGINCTKIISKTSIKRYYSSERDMVDA